MIIYQSLPTFCGQLRLANCAWPLAAFCQISKTLKQLRRKSWQEKTPPQERGDFFSISSPLMELVA
jgi:hypothetical protein